MNDNRFTTCLLITALLGWIRMKKIETNYDEFSVIYNEIDEFMRKELNLDYGVPHTEFINRISKKIGNFHIIRRIYSHLLDFVMQLCITQRKEMLIPLRIPMIML